MSSANRRQMLKLIGGVVGAGSIAGTLVFASDNASKATGTAEKLRDLPWPYKPLDPDVVAQRAFESFKRGDCMYGAFESIVGSIADQLGEPYKSFPFMLFKFGAGGIHGWGTVCGAASGAAAAFQMLSSQPGPLIDSLFANYETEPLPNFRPKGAKYAEVRSVSGTPLCHTSVSQWCKASNKHTYSPERAERCAAVAASVARKAVLLLNEQAANKPLTVSAMAADTQGCMTCHEKGGALENTRGKMTCGECHAPLVGKHP